MDISLEKIAEPQTNEPPAPPVNPVTPSVDGRPLSQKMDDIKADFARQMIQNAQQSIVNPGIPETAVAPGIPAVPTAVVSEPAQPAQPQAPENPPTVPEKFLNKDGTPSIEKIQQSTVNLEKVLAQYREKEKEFTKLRQQKPVEQFQAAQTPEPVPQTFEEQINADLQKEGPARVLAKLFNAAKEAARAEVMGEVRGLQQEVELTKRDKELESLASHDPFVLTEQGLETLAKIRVEKPWLNQSPRPWESAYRDYLADKQLSQRAVPQVSPTPKGMTAPVAPAVPVARAPVSPAPDTSNMTKEQINAFLAGKSSQEVAAFYRSLGLPFDIGWAQKRGV